jgi:ribosome biogenesis GTPase A
MPIQWFPLHMAKAEKALRQMLPQVDVVLEVVDARLPRSSSNPRLAEMASDKARIIILNKADLAERGVTAKWISALTTKTTDAVALVASDRGRVLALIKRAKALVPERGTPIKPVRLLVCGIPNVGKSTLLNTLMGRRVAKVGDEPGVTKGQQRIRLEPAVYLLDTPGLLWPKFDDVAAGYRLAASGAVRDTAMEEVDVAKFAVKFLSASYPQRIRERYRLTELDADPEVTLREIGRRRGCLIAGGEVELTKAAQILLHELRSGVLGAISFETPRG